MRIVPIDIDMDLAASDLVRSPGLHMSTIYNGLYADLYPERYGRGGLPDRTTLGMGFVLEDVLEDAFKRRITRLAGESAFRPSEFKTAEGIAFSPDYLISNGVLRLGESKLTWMSAGAMPTEPATSVDERFSKWFCQMMAYCLAPSTRVLTHDLRWVEINTLSVGDKLLGFSERPNTGNKRRRWEVATVEAVGRLVKECYELTFEDGTEIVCSEDHQWLACWSGTRYRWAHTSMFPRFDAVSVCKPLNPWSLDASHEGGYLAGFFDGEGCLSAAGDDGTALILSASQNQGVVLDRARDYLRTCFGGVEFGAYSRGQGNVTVLHAHRFSEILRFLGTYRPSRLLQKFQTMQALPATGLAPLMRVTRCRKIGKHPVVAVQTSSRTFIAEGFASHNCEALETCHARLIACFVNGGYEHQRRGARRGQPPTPQLRAYDIEFSSKELRENKQMLLNYAKSKGWL